MPFSFSSASVSQQLSTNQQWHQLSIQETAESLRTQYEVGITVDEVALRQQQFGRNQLIPKEKTNLWVKFLQQFDQPLLYILLLAGMISLVLQEWVDAGVIFAVVVINAIVGYVQEAKAEQAMAALADSMVTEATAIRQGKRQTLFAAELVPGDLVQLEAGDKVPADLRLTAAKNLQIDESAMTGESVPVDKKIAPLPIDTALGDRINMAFAGTIATAGQGRGLVVATGENTETGQISELIDRQAALTTPLARKLEQFSWQLLYVILGLAAFVLVLGLGRNQPLSDTFQTAVALAVSGIPEELPSLVTIALAIGVSRMASRHAIIRKLPAVETLGNATVICSDKTGTLTENQMTVEQIYAGNKRYEVSGVGYSLKGSILYQKRPINSVETSALQACLTCGLLCNDSSLQENATQPGVEGDPTEGALLVAARKAGLVKSHMDSAQPRVDVIPFDSEYRYMATLHRSEGSKRIIYIKGATEAVLSRCHSALVSRLETVPIAYDDINRIKQIADEFAQRGLRVLAFAQKTTSDEIDAIEHEDIESDLVFLGLQGMIDPPRQEAIRAVRACQEAGIQVKMVTGDHAITAKAVAQAMNLFPDDVLPNKASEDRQVLIGAAISQMSDEIFRNAVESSVVFARVAPAQKLQLIRALQENGHVVAMTGDGVNDAPALKQADIGIAMGVSGTEVAKEASDMILTDDNFASIEAAVEEGRTVYLNLKKAIAFVLPVNGGESLTILASVLSGSALPILPLQILWLNMVSSSALSIPLAFEPQPDGVMKLPPRDPHQPLLSGSILWRVGLISLFNWAVTFSMFHQIVSLTGQTDLARTMAVQTLVAAEIFYLLCISRLIPSTWTKLRSTLLQTTQQQPAQSFIYAPAAGIVSVVVLQVLFSQLPLLNRLFSTVPLTWSQGLICLGAGTPIVLVERFLNWRIPLKS